MSAPAKYDYDVTVAGAGPTGLVMACELAARGLRVLLVDKLAERSLRSRALVMHARSLELFQKMGLVDEFIAAGQTTVGLRVFGEGAEKAHVTFRDIGAADTPYPYLLMESQAETERILIARAERLGVPVTRATELVGFNQDDSGVIVTLSSAGADGGLYKVRSKYLVGCDGAHSKVRKGLGLDFPGAPYPQEFLLADVKLEDWPHPYDELQLFYSMKGLLVIFPMEGRELSRLIVTRRGHSDQNGAEAGGTTTTEVSAEEVESAARLLSKTNVRVTKPRWLANFRLHHRAVAKYGEGRIFVAGDAAHIHSPAGGQGMNTGIQDAFNLAWKLALVAKDKAPPDLLQSYDAERQPVGQFLLKRTDRFFEAMASESWLVLKLRNLLTPIVLRALFLGPRSRRQLAFRFVSQLAIRHEPSKWISEGAGRRAPDARIGDTTLFEMMRGPDFHLLCFGSPPPSGLDPELVKAHTLQLKTAREAFERYKLEDGRVPTYCLVRPDGYIAYIGNDPQRLAKDHAFVMRATQL